MIIFNPDPRKAILSKIRKLEAAGKFPKGLTDDQAIEWYIQKRIDREIPPDGNPKYRAERLDEDDPRNN